MNTEKKIDIEKMLDAWLNFCDAVEAACVDFKHRVAELTGVKEAPAVKEDTFNILKFETVKSDRLPGLEAAHKLHNVEQNWTHAYGVLKAANATINSRYYGEAYGFSYWIYGEDRIFRQPLKQSK